MNARDTVAVIFQELVGEKAKRLDASLYLADVNSRITEALARSEKEADVLAADQIGFHLIDWQADAAFIVALALYPERFSDEEVREGVEAFLIHVPSHALEAARLAGIPVSDLSDDQEKRA